MMHHQFDSFPFRVTVQSSDVKIRIGGHEIKYIILLLPVPVFPTYVPPLYKQLVETMSGCEIYISPDILIVRAMPSMRCGLGIIESCQVKILCFRIAPSAFTRDHLPPYTHVFYRVYP